MAWDAECTATQRDVTHLASNHEEADTKLVLHAIEATSNGASSIEICSPDTDVFVLALRYFPDLCDGTTFVTGTGEKRRSIPLKPIYDALGPCKATALPGLHALSGADVTGSFAGKGKLAFWKAFKCASDEVVSALSNLGKCLYPSEDIFCGMEELICQVYHPDTPVKKVEKVRWWLFAKRQAQAERLPPTQDALRPAILRAHYQSMIWNQANTANPDIPSPADYGWKLEEERWVPVMTLQLPAPQSVLQLVKCSCSKSRCQSAKCSCQKAGLNCTDICGCSNAGDICENQMRDAQNEEEKEEEFEDMY